MDRLEAMAMLLEVVRHGSFSQAGRAMGVSLPTLSRRISELEARLGARLLTRTTRTLSLTSAGVAYVAAARDILDQVRAAEREAAGEFAEPIGELVVTAPTLFGRLHVVPIVADFLARHPAIRVRLVLSNANLGLVEEGVDIAIRIGELPDSAMMATRVGALRTVLCGSPALLTAHGEPETVDDLARFPIIDISMPAAFPRWRFGLDGSRDARPSLQPPRLIVTTPAAAVAAAIRGAGLTQVLHYQAAKAVRDQALRIVLEDQEPPATPVHLLHVSRAPLPLKLRSFLDHATSELRKALSAL